MDARLTTEEAEATVSMMITVATAIFARENDPVLETVQASRPLSMSEYLGLKRHPGVIEVQGRRFAHGIPDMEGLLFEHRGRPYVAAKIFRFGLRRRRPGYWVYCMEDYLNWLCGNDWYSLGDARQRAAQALRELTALLPDGQPLDKSN